MNLSKKLFITFIVISFLLSLLFLVAGQESFVFAAEEQYRVRWHDANGEIIYSEDVAKNTLPKYDSNWPLPMKEGQDGKFYFFTEWSPAIEPVTQDVDYYPQYREEDHEFEIILYFDYDYDNSGIINDAGDIYEVIELNRYDVIEYPFFDYSYEVGTTRYVLCGWDCDVWGFQAIQIQLLHQTNILYVYALYDTVPADYMITWIDGNGNILDVDMVLKGEIPEYKLPYPPTKRSTEYYDFDFTGWDKTPYPVDKDETYYAQFESRDRYYYISWLNGNSSIIYQEALRYGEPLNYDFAQYGTPQRERIEFYKYFKFVGWENYNEGDTVTESKMMVPKFISYNELDEEYGVLRTHGIPREGEDNASVNIEIDKLDVDKPLEIISLFNLSFSSDAIKEIKNKGNSLNIKLTLQKKNGKEYGLNINTRFIIEADIDGQPLEKFDGEVMGIYQTREASRERSIWKIDGKKAETIDCDCWIDESYRFEITSCGEYVLGKRDFTLVITLSTVLPFLAISIFLVVFFGLKQKKKLQIN